jgi:signal transduction histidine kinase
MIEWVNDAFAQRFHNSGYSLVGQPMLNHFSDERITDYWLLSLKNHEGFTAEITMDAGSSGEYTALMEVQPSYDDMGRFRNFILIETDITEIKRAQVQLRIALEKERELGNLKSRLVMMTSHEFRTPLAVIWTIYQSLRDFYDRMDAEQRQKRFDRFEDQIRYMTGILDDILLINRIDEGKMTMQLETFALDGLLLEIVEELRRKESSAVLELPETLPAIEIQADQTLVRQIITNLLSNAIKYSVEKQPVEISLQMQNGQAVLIVRDQGIGIPEKDQPLIFEAFHRAENVGKIKGVGFGLSIVKRAVDIHRGKISFVSKEGEGSTFTVSLPLAVPQSAITALPETSLA